MPHTTRIFYWSTERCGYRVQTKQMLCNGDAATVSVDFVSCNDRKKKTTIIRCVMLFALGFSSSYFASSSRLRSVCCRLNIFFVLKIVMEGSQINISSILLKGDSIVAESPPDRRS